MKIPRDLSGAEVVRSLQRLGFTVLRQKGSHVRMAKGDKRLTIPMHRSVTVGTLQSILRQANLIPCRVISCGLFIHEPAA